MNMREIVGEKNIAAGRYWSKTLTLVKGCTPVSEGCQHCWSAAMASRFPWGKGFAEGGKWTGKIVWNERVAQELRSRGYSIPGSLKPQVFCIWNDLFHERINPYDVNDVLAAMANCAKDVFLILTKRPENLSIIENRFYDHPPPNIWLGVTVERQKYIHRINTLCHAWQGRKFVSVEPCLGPLWFTPWLARREHTGTLLMTQNEEQRHLLDWILLGGETGPHARPMHSDWVRSVRDQCVETGVPLFFKGRGEWSSAYAGEPKKAKTLIINRGDDSVLKMWRVGKKKTGRLLDGRTWDEMPEVKNEQDD